MTTGGRGGEHLGPVLFLLDGDFFAGFFDDRVEAELLRDLSGDVAGNVLIDRRHRADLDQLADDVAHRNDHRRRKLLNGEQVGNFDRFEHARRCGGGRLALLLAMALFLEQQFFLAVFFGRGFVLVNSRTVAGARAARRRRSVGGGRNAGACRSGPNARRHRTEGTVAGGTASGRHYPRLNRRARLCGCALAALSGKGLAGARRYAGPAGEAGLGTGRGRGAGGGRRRLPAGDRCLAGRHRPKLRDRLVGRLRCGGPARRRGFDHGLGGRRGSAASAAGAAAGAGAAGLGAVRAVLPGDGPQTGDGRCRRRTLRRRGSLGLSRRRRGHSGRRAGSGAGALGLGGAGAFWVGLEQHAADQIGDLIGNDAELILCLEDAAQAFVEERRQFFRGEPDLFGELENSYFSGQIHSRARRARVPSVGVRSPNRRLWLR